MKRGTWLFTLANKLSSSTHCLRTRMIAFSSLVILILLCSLSLCEVSSNVSIKLTNKIDGNDGKHTDVDWYCVPWLWLFVLFGLPLGKHIGCCKESGCKEREREDE